MTDPNDCDRKMLGLVSSVKAMLAQLLECDHVIPIEVELVKFLIKLSSRIA